jgi:hypothetical protein
MQALVGMRYFWVVSQSHKGPLTFILIDLFCLNNEHLLYEVGL